MVLKSVKIRNILRFESKNDAFKMVLKNYNNQQPNSYDGNQKICSVKTSNYINENNTKINQKNKPNQIKPNENH